MTRKTIDKKDITAEMLLELDKELARFTVKLDERLNNLLPTHIFQEIRTNGHLWWKKTYTVYFRYCNGTMQQMSVMNQEDFERNR